MADPARPFPRPPADGFPNHRVYPKLEGKTLADLALRPNLGLGFTCRACGRHIILTNLGIREAVRRGRCPTLEEIARRAVCQTCGAQEAFVSMSIFDTVPLVPVVVYREFHNGPRHDRPSPTPLRFRAENPCGWL